MKNLFKNLMLVAVAAMAFTACQNDNNEVNEVAKKTVISGVLSFDEGTRSGFVGTETTDNGDGTNTTVYKSAWDNGDKIKLFANGLETTTTVDAEGKFTAEFEGQLPESFFMTVCSPAESWSSQDFSTIPAEQTPSANSVDPLAHILKVQNVQVTNGSADAAKMDHQVAYGKMTVNGVDFDIDHVVVDLKGTFFGYDRELSYTINADNVDNNTFWFATDVIDVAEFTVTAYDAEGNNVVAKTVDVAAAGKTLSFNYGRVSTFSVSGLDAPAVPEVPKFTSAKWTNTWAPSDKLVQFYSEELGTLQLNFYNCNEEALLDARTYGFAQSGDIYPGGSYSTYVNAEGVNYLVVAGSVNVSVVGGEYYIEFNGLTDYEGSYSLTATFKGAIEGLNVPDARTPLATPEVTYELNGKTLTLSWNAVDGAVGYYVHDYYYDVDTTTTDTTLTVELTEYKWYYIYVSAVAAADNPDFKNSNKTEISFELKDPRTVLSSPANVKATIDGRYATISWDKVEGADYYQLSYYLNGNQTVDVAETSHTLDVGFDVSDLWIYVFAKANEDNPNYKSSESWNSYAVVNTGSDPSIVPTAFTTCELNEYIPAQWRVSYNFSDGANNSMTLWLTTDHGASDASLGGTQEYNQFYSSPGSVGNYYRFCPENIVVNGESKTATGGSVKVESLGTSWNVTIKLTIDGSQQIFTYSGGIGVETGGDDSGDDSGEFTPDYTINTFSYYRMSTSYYTHQWSVQTSNGLSFSIYTPYSQGAELHEGTYVYYNGNGNTNGDFTFSTRTFSPAPGSGTMVVSKDGDTYTINLTVVVGGTTQKYQYIGTL